MAEYKYAGVSLTRLIAGELGLEVCKERPVWETGQLCKRLIDVHVQKGGLAPRAKLNKLRSVVLPRLCAMHVLEQITRGKYRTLIATAASNDIENSNSDIDANNNTSKPTIDELVTIDRTIGNGTQGVYVMHAKDRALATGKGRGRRWPCKVGMSTSSVKARVAAIAIGAYPPPVVGLLINTNNCTQLEQVIHGWLHLHERRLVDAPGNEWFMTSPAEIERVYRMLIK